MQEWLRLKTAPLLVRAHRDMHIVWEPGGPHGQGHASPYWSFGGAGHFYEWKSLVSNNPSRRGGSQIQLDLHSKIISCLWCWSVTNSTWPNVPHSQILSNDIRCYQIFSDIILYYVCIPVESPPPIQEEKGMFSIFKNEVGAIKKKFA